VAVLVAAMALANVVLLMVNREAGTEPRAVDKARPVAGASSPSAKTGPDTGVTPGASRSTAAGDGPPNHADNNSWKQRHDPSADELATGEELAARIRPKLEALRAAGDFAPASTRQALLDLGIAPEALMVEQMRQPPGSVFAVRFGDRGCVIGDVRPERVLVQVTGAAAEYGCLEPFTH
jgi:hypothetical protein